MPESALGRRRGTRDRGRPPAFDAATTAVAMALSMTFALALLAALLLAKGRREEERRHEVAHGLRGGSNSSALVGGGGGGGARDSVLGAAADGSVYVNRFPPDYPKVTGRGPPRPRLSREALDMCGRTLWHTLETTTIVLPDGEAFVHTGDIDDLWLRDSAAQVHPLLVPWFRGWPALVGRDPKLARVVSGLMRRTAWYVRHDPYANAFRIDDTYVFNEKQKAMGRHDFISTWNYELDSGCYYMRMLYFFYRALPDSPVLRSDGVREAVEIMVDLWIAEQDHEGDAYPEGPLFDCKNCGRPYRYPGLPRDGKGSPVARTGMTWTGFRPSDDECEYGYLVPANMFAVVALRYVAELAPALWAENGGRELGEKALNLASEIDEGIKEHAIVEHPTHGRIYAYEVDGLGNSLLMDDANVPSLMSIPYLGYDFEPEVYTNTRRFILSTDNPTYQKGKNRITGDIEGYGSPHMAAAVRHNIWPMSLAVQGLTSTDPEEKVMLVEKLVKATGGTGWMHESFDVKDPKHYTRSWFCWADALFAELVMSVTDECPLPLQKYHIMSWRDPIDIKGGAYSEEA